MSFPARTASASLRPAARPQNKKPVCKSSRVLRSAYCQSGLEIPVFPTRGLPRPDTWNPSHKVRHFFPNSLRFENFFPIFHNPEPYKPQKSSPKVKILHQIPVLLRIRPSLVMQQDIMADRQEWMGCTHLSVLSPAPFGHDPPASFSRLGKYLRKTAEFQRRCIRRHQPLHAFHGRRRQYQAQSSGRFQQTFRNRNQILERQSVRMPGLVALLPGTLQGILEIRRIGNNPAIRPRTEIRWQLPVIRMKNRDIFPIAGIPCIGRCFLARSHVQIHCVHPCLPRFPSHHSKPLRHHQGNQAATTTHIQKTLGRARQGIPARKGQIPRIRFFRQAGPGSQQYPVRPHLHRGMIVFYTEMLEKESRHYVSFRQVLKTGRGGFPAGRAETQLRKNANSGRGHSRESSR